MGHVFATYAKDHNPMTHIGFVSLYREKHHNMIYVYLIEKLFTVKCNNINYLRNSNKTMGDIDIQDK